MGRVNEEEKKKRSKKKSFIILAPGLCLLFLNQIFKIKS